MSELIPAGQLLAAWPDLMDPNFMHKVIVMCRHSAEGAFGLVLNDPIAVGSRELLSSHPVMGQLDFPIYRGGPVDDMTMQYLHREPEQVSGSQQVSDELWMGGNFDDLADLIQADVEAAKGRVRLFLGYSGWSDEQLQGELEGGSWVPAAERIDEVFAADSAGSWRRVLRGIGDVGKRLADMPPDPDWN